MVNRNSINDYPITIHDVKHSHAIFSPDFAGVRGKTVRHKLENVTMYYFSIPREVLKLHKYVTVVYDVTFVNNILFLITMYWGIRFITVEHVPTCTANQLSKSLRRILCSYSCGSMVVQNILMDIEFEKQLMNWWNIMWLIPMPLNNTLQRSIGVSVQRKNTSEPLWTHLFSSTFIRQLLQILSIWWSFGWMISP